MKMIALSLLLEMVSTQKFSPNNNIKANSNFSAEYFFIKINILFSSAQKNINILVMRDEKTQEIILTCVNEKAIISLDF